MASGRPLWEGHRERLRRRMEREGWDALRPHEMVELVLYHAVPRQDLSDISRVLVDRFGSVGGVFRASREELLAVDGVTPTLADCLLTTGRLMRAYYDMHAQRGIQLRHWQDFLAFLKPRVAAAKGASLWAAYADFDFNLITYTDLSGAEHWWDAENARKLVAEAVDTGARFVYLVRFLPCAADDLDNGEKAWLASIAVALRAVDAELVDCALAGGGELHSMNAEGRLQRVRAESGILALHEEYATGKGSAEQETGSGRSDGEAKP